jgi:transcriptional regulator with XRE-family HTH domain
MDLVPMLAPVRDLGSFIRDQRQNAQLSLRGLAARAGISNPYLSQVERGLRRPSADILAQIAQGLSISVESLLAKAGVLPDRTDQHAGHRGQADRGRAQLPEVQAPLPEVIDAIGADTTLTTRQKSALIEVYLAFQAVPGRSEIAIVGGSRASEPRVPTDEVPHQHTSATNDGSPVSKGD